MKRLIRSVAAVAFAAGIAAAFAGQAAADMPIVLEKNRQLTSDVAQSAACQPYGYTLTFSSHFDVTRTVTNFVDNDGNVIRQVLEIHFIGTSTNDLTGKTLDVNGQRHIVLDFAANTFTETGVLRHVTAAGTGIVLHESGRLVGPRPIGSAPPTFEAGPHELTEHELGDFCAVLADP